MPVLADGERQIDQTIAEYLGERGTLYLTDRRILFEYMEGVIHKKFHQLGASLRDISTVGAKHSCFGGQELIIGTRNVTNGFRTTQIFFKLTSIPELWINKINNLLATSLNSSPSPVVVEKEVVKIPCKYCGTLVDVFRSNTCTQCGAPAH